MKNDSINYVLVGTFVVAMVTALLFAIALLTGRTGGATDTYFTSYDDATGLKYGSQVLYMGSPVGQVEEIIPKVEEVLLEVNVVPNQEFSFAGTASKGTLGTEVVIEVDGRENTRIHTSCSQPIGPGLVSGDFEVVEGKSREGGLLCPVGEDGDEDKGKEKDEDTGLCGCEGKVIELTLRYIATGPDPVPVKVVQKMDGLVFKVELSVSKDLRKWKVPANSVAEVRAAGLLAPITIDIRTGDSDRLLKPGDHLEGRGRADVFAAVQETASTLRDVTVSSVRPLLENLNARVSSFGEVLDTKGGPLIENLSVLSEDLAERGPEVISAFLDTTADLRSVSGRLRAVLSEENERKVATVLDNVARVSGELARLADDAEGLLEILLGPADLAGVGRFIEDASQTATETLALSRSARVKLDRVLSEENLGHVERSLVNVEQVTARAGELVSEGNVGSVKRTLANVEQVSARAGELMSEGNVSSVQRTVANVEQVTARAGELVSEGNVASVQRSLANVEQVTARAGELLSEGNVASVQRSLANVEQATARAGELVSEANLASIERTIANVERASEDVRSMVDEETQAAVDATVRNVQDASAGLRALVADTRGQVGALLGPETRKRLDRTLDNVSLASANIATLSTALESRLGEILTPEMSAKLKLSLENFASAAGSIARLSNGLLESRQLLDALLVSLNETTNENRPGIRDSVRALRHSLQVVSRHIDTVANNLEGTSRNLFELSRRLKGNPGLLLRTPEAVDEARRTGGGG